MWSKTYFGDCICLNLHNHGGYYGPERQSTGISSTNLQRRSVFFPKPPSLLSNLRVSETPMKNKPTVVAVVARFSLSTPALSITPPGVNQSRPHPRSLRPRTVTFQQRWDSEWSKGEAYWKQLVVGQSLQLEWQSAALFNLDRLKELRGRGIAADPRGQRICEQDRNSFSWARCSAVRNCPVEAFEVEIWGNAVEFKGKSNARLRSTLLVTCVHFAVLFGCSEVLHTIPVSLFLSHTQTPAHTLCSYLNGFSQRGVRRRQKYDVCSGHSVILKIFVRHKIVFISDLGGPLLKNWISWTDVTVPGGAEVNVSKR